jgi:hypothetical protein
MFSILTMKSQVPRSATPMVTPSVASGSSAQASPTNSESPLTVSPSAIGSAWESAPSI